MPELPEVEALRDFLAHRIIGRTYQRIDLLDFSALKTFKPPLDDLVGREIEAVNRYGKYVDIQADGVHLVFHLARGGWLQWKDPIPTKPVRPSSRNPLALRVTLDNGQGFDLTEAGTQKRLAIWVTDDVSQIENISTLGPDPLSPDFTKDNLSQILQKAQRARLKGVLRDQRILAGIGNAYSDEILHAARLSPYKPSNSLTEAELDQLWNAIDSELADAVKRTVGKEAKELKGEKKQGLSVHGKAGQPCDVCGDTIAEVSFSDSAFQYCPTCQTGGKKLADRRLSKLLK